MNVMILSNIRLQLQHRLKQGKSFLKDCKTFLMQHAKPFHEYVMIYIDQ